MAEKNHAMSFGGESILQKAKRADTNLEFGKELGAEGYTEPFNPVAGAGAKNQRPALGPTGERQG